MRMDPSCMGSCIAAKETFGTQNIGSKKLESIQSSEISPRILALKRVVPPALNSFSYTIRSSYVSRWLTCANRFFEIVAKEIQMPIENGRSRHKLLGWSGSIFSHGAGNRNNRQSRELPKRNCSFLLTDTRILPASN